MQINTPQCIKKYLRKNIEMKWDLITVTFNSSEVLKRNWSWYNEWSNQINWIVVDNDSQDDTFEVAQDLGARVIRSSKNLGFGAGCNLGFNLSESPFILFANPDLQINPVDLSLIESTLRANPSLVSPQLINPNGSRQINGRGKPYLSAKLAHRGISIFNHRLESYLPETSDNQLTKVTWLMGACIATKRDLFIQLGKWNEKYFIYYEDHDLGMRANELGIDVLIDSRIRWSHEWARATNSFNVLAWYHEFRSASIFYRKYPKLLR